MAGPIRRYLEAALGAAELEREAGGFRARIPQLGVEAEGASAPEVLRRLEDAAEEALLDRLFAGEPLPAFGEVRLEPTGTAPPPDPLRLLARLKRDLSRLEAALGGAGPGSESDPLIAWLSERGLKVVRVFADEGPEMARVLNRLALFIGGRYPVLAKCLKKLKAALSTGKPLVHSLQKAASDEIQAVTQLCTLFKDYAFFEEYHYKGRIVRAKPARDPRFINFVNGGWLERYLALLLERELPGPKRLLRGLQFTLPEGEQGELDLLLRWRDRVFWIEAKTANFQDRIRRYAELRKRLGLPPEASFLVLLDVPKERREKLAGLYQLSVVEPGELLARIREQAGA